MGAKKTVSIHPKIVTERLNHSGITITLNLYSHIVPGIQAAASRLDDMVFKKENKLKRELKLKHIMNNSY
jgi:integrase